MLNTLRQLLRRLLGRDQEPQDYRHDQTGRPVDKPDTAEAVWLNRPPDEGDWFRERLRSLPDEEKNRKPEGPKHHRGR